MMIKRKQIPIIRRQKPTEYCHIKDDGDEGNNKDDADERDDDGDDDDEVR